MQQNQLHWNFASTVKAADLQRHLDSGRAKKALSEKKRFPCTCTTFVNNFSFQVPPHQAFALPQGFFEELRGTLEIPEVHGSRAEQRLYDSPPQDTQQK